MEAEVEVETEIIKVVGLELEVKIYISNIIINSHKN